MNATHESVLIVGAGPIGLACAISCRRRGGDPLVIDAGPIANSIFRYPVGMTFFTTPERLEIGDHPLVTAGQKATREEALKYYRGVVRTERIRVRTHARLLGAARENSLVRCRLGTRLGEEQLSCDRLVLATGYFDFANRLNIPGEDLPHVSHWFDEPHRTAGERVVIVGGKNSAVEAALLCFRAGAQVTLVHRGEVLKQSVKYWLAPDFHNRVKAGEVQARFGARVLEITPREVVICNDSGTTEPIPADRVYALTGYHPDFGLFRSIGITFNDDSGRPSLDPDTLETNVPGVYLAGSVTAGRNISEVFIENGRFDGEKIFGDPASRQQADERYRSSGREIGE